MAAHRNKPLNSRAVVLTGAVAAALFIAAPGAARAGFFDFLFGGGFARPSAPSNADSYAEPSAPAPGGTEAVRPGGGSIGRSVSFCVRLCDGQNFPMEHIANATPVETCRSMCPASKTKVFSGGEIDHAVASDGAHYADLDNAYVYRKHLVANCTCNGKDTFGLARLDVKNDPTLRPGDIVSTKDGLMAYAGKRGQVATFTPVEASSVSAELNSVTARPQGGGHVAEAERRSGAQFRARHDDMESFADPHRQDDR